LSSVLSVRRPPRRILFPCTTLFRSWNDVSALGQAPDSLAAAAELGCEVVLMHMKGAPKSMQDDPRYDDVTREVVAHLAARAQAADRKSTRLNSSHVKISYAVFCLKK